MNRITLAPRRVLGAVLLGAFVVVALPRAPAADAATDSDRVLALVNAYRHEHGLAPVTRNETLERAARAHAAAMAKAGRLSHNRPDGTLTQRMVRSGYAYSIVAEDLAEGTRTPEDTVAGWEQSPPHARNLLVPSVRDAGVGHATAGTKDDAQDYWSLILAKPAEQ